MGTPKNFKPIWDGLDMLEHFGHIQLYRDFQRSNQYEFLVPFPQGPVGMEVKDFVKPTKEEAEYYWKYLRPSIQYRLREPDQAAGSPSYKNPKPPKFKLPENTIECDEAAESF